MPSRVACSCADWRFHGGNLTRQRLANKTYLAAIVDVVPDKEPGDFMAWTDPNDIHHVTLAKDGQLDRLCKHCIAVLWDQGVSLYLVEYDNPPWEDAPCEVKTEAFWGDALAVKAIMHDGEVLTVTKLERRQDEG